MSRLSDVQSFIDISRGLRNPADLEALLQSITREMGFDHFALMQHVDLTPFQKELGHMVTGQLIGLSDYPEHWIDQYIDDNIVTYDPVLLASQRTNVGFSWSQLDQLIEMKRPHLEQLERGRKAGIGDGFTVPSNVPGEANGSCNFVVRSGRELPRKELMMAQLVGSYAFEAGRSIITHAKTSLVQKVQLSPRQIECIVLVGRGKTDWEISRILGIAESTVKDYINDAKARYNVVKRVQMVIRAVYDGHLPISELLR
ncbi:MAG: LuxR family transcriptional regulator [Novosphingobium sp.]|nr:LuxR family transcriptional regulator [Novosphingobium sp.]